LENTKCTTKITGPIVHGSACEEETQNMFGGICIGGWNSPLERKRLTFLKLTISPTEPKRQATEVSWYQKVFKNYRDLTAVKK